MVVGVSDCLIQTRQWQSHRIIAHWLQKSVFFTCNNTGLVTVAFVVSLEAVRAETMTTGLVQCSQYHSKCNSNSTDTSS